MDSLYFKATSMENAVNDYGVLVVGFFSQEHYLMIQLAVDMDKENAIPGMDTYHIERDDQSYGNYGGVAEVSLSTGQIIVKPDERGQKFLKCSEIKIDFDHNPEQIKKLKESLKQIFQQAFIFKS